MLLIEYAFTKRLRPIVGVTVLTCSILGMFWLGWQARTLNNGLVAPEESLDFGDVWESNSFHWTFPIENRTDKQVKILRLATSCSCVSVSPQSMTLKAEEKADIHLILDLTRKQSELSLSIRPFEVQIIPLVEGGIAHQRGWTIRGNVRSAISLSPSYYNLGDVLVTGKRIVKEAIVTAHIPLGSLSATSNSRMVSTKITNRNEDKTFQLDIIVFTNLEIGPLRAEARLHPIAVNGQPFPEVVVPIYGTVVEDVQSMPSSVVFGVQSVKKRAEAIICLNSRQRISFEVLTIHNPIGAHVEPITMRALPESRAFRVIQDITQKGIVSDEIVFKLRSQNGRAMKLTVPVFYYGREE